MWYLCVGAMFLVDCWSFIVDGSVGTIAVVKACANCGSKSLCMNAEFVFFCH